MEGNSDYIYTKNGPIYKYDIPVVVNEKLDEKAQKAGLFFIVIIVVFMILFYLAKTEYETQRTATLNKVILKDNANCVKTSIEMDGLIIHNTDNNTSDFLENIILIDKTDNTFDIKFNKYKKYYSAYLPQMYEIKEIILIGNKKKYVNLACYKLGKVVWKYAGWIETKENSIPIVKKII